MTTMPTFIDRTDVEDIEARAAANPVDWRAVGLAVLAVVPLLIGRAIGLLAWAASYVVAAFMTGYEAGRGPVSTPAPDTHRPRAAVVRRTE